MFSKSEFAFLCSAETFFAQNSRVYFWTFTCVEVHPDWYYGQIWHQFMVQVQNLYCGTLKGLKVVELHKEHGIHWHCLLNKRVWVGEVRRIGARVGIGRIHVRKADLGGIDYLREYLTKDYKSKNYVFATIRRWGTIGGFVASKVKDIEIDSPFHRRVKIYQEMTGQKQIGWVPAMLLMEMVGDDREYIQRVARQYAFSNQ